MAPARPSGRWRWFRGGKVADHVIIGSGINGLVAASLLALKGDRVMVPERAATHPGGCLRTEDPAPGYQHDVTATTFLLVMTSPARAALGPHLVRHGFDYCHSPHPTAVLRPDGQAVAMAMDGAANVKKFNALSAGNSNAFAIDTDSIGADPPFLCALPGQRLRSWPTAKLLFGQARKRGLRGLAGWFGRALDSARGWLEAIYRSEAMQALLAPWVLHTGLTVESAYSGQMGRVIAFSPEVAGAPILKGVAGQAAQALQALISENGGKARCNSDVDRIIVRNGKVASVRLADGEDIATTSVLASVAPGQLYDRLMQGVTPPDDRSALHKFRHGRGNFQPHFALNAPPEWLTPVLDRVALIHLSDGIDSVSKSSNEAEGGMLPVTPTNCVGQPARLDSTRCPKGNAAPWMQIPDAPRVNRGDAAGEIEGTDWDDVRAAFVERLERILS